MAKRPQATEAQRLAEEAQMYGVSTASLEESKAHHAQMMKEAYQTGTSSVTLTIAGEPIEFDLVIIPNNEILSRTEVISENEREQQYVNRLSVISLTNQIKAIDQTVPALAQKRDDGTIEVIDGSQRRMACYYAGKDYATFVAKINFASSTRKTISRSSNEHKELSILERGNEWQKMLIDGKYTDQKSLADGEKVNSATVTIGLKAASLPKELFDVFPSVTDLGKESITKLHKLFECMDPFDAALRIEEFKSDYSDNIQQLVDSAQSIVDVRKANNATIQMLTDSLTSDTQDAKAPKYQSMPDGSKGNAVLNKKRFSLDVRNVSDEFLTAMTELLKDFGLAVENTADKK